MNESSIQIRDMYIVGNREESGEGTHEKKSRFPFFSIFLILVVLIVGAGYIMGHSLFSANSYFHLEHTTVSGIQHISSDEIIRLISLPRGSRLFNIDLQKIHNQILLHPWVAQCRITRQMPDTLIVDITECEPVTVLALIENYLMDAQGKILEKLGRENTYNVPFIRGSTPTEAIEIGSNVKDPLVQNALSWVRSIKQIPAFDGRLRFIDISDKNNLKLFFAGITPPIHVGLGLQNQKLTRLLILMNFIEMGEMDFDYIDLRFKNRIILKPVYQIEG